MTTNTGLGIVQAAYEDAGLCSVGQVISVGQQARGVDRLNDIAILEATQGLKLWLNQDVTVPLTSGTAGYILGPGGAVSMTRPLQVTLGRWVPTSGSATPLQLISKEEYFRLIQTNSTGAINSFYADKQATYVKVYFWNTPDTNTALGTVILNCRVAIDAIGINAATVFPQEWVMFLRWALADELATGQPQPIQDRCAQRAAVYRSALESFDVEDASTQAQADGRAYGGGRGFR